MLILEALKAAEGMGASILHCQEQNRIVCILFSNWEILGVAAWMGGGDVAMWFLSPDDF